MLFEAKYTEYDAKDSISLFVILSRFVNEHRAISCLHLLPEWLNEYVKYDNPAALPKSFLNLCITNEKLETLRMCLGMYPTKLS